MSSIERAAPGGARAAAGPPARAADERRGALRGARRGDRRGTRRGPGRDLHLRVRRRAARASPRRSSARPRAASRCASSSTASAPTTSRAEWQQRWQAAGVHWRVFNPARGWRVLLPQRWRRLHRKLCVVDGAGRFCGGINLIDDYRRPDLRQARAAALRLRRARHRAAGRRRPRDDDAPVAAHAGRRAKRASFDFAAALDGRAQGRARRHRRRRSAHGAPRTSSRRAPSRRAGHPRRPGAARQRALSQAHRALLPLRDRPGAERDPDRQRLLRPRRRPAARAAARRPSAASQSRCCCRAATSTSCSTTPAGRCTA